MSNYDPRFQRDAQHGYKRVARPDRSVAAQELLATLGPDASDRAARLSAEVEADAGASPAEVVADRVLAHLAEMIKLQASHGGIASVRADGLRSIPKAEFDPENDGLQPVFDEIKRDVVLYADAAGSIYVRMSEEPASGWEFGGSTLELQVSDLYPEFLIVTGLSVARINAALEEANLGADAAEPVVVLFPRRAVEAESLHTFRLAAAIEPTSALASGDSELVLVASDSLGRSIYADDDTGHLFIDAPDTTRTLRLHDGTYLLSNSPDHPGLLRIEGLGYADLRDMKERE